MFLGDSGRDSFLRILGGSIERFHWICRTLRNQRIRELMKSGLYSPSEIGRHLGLHCSTVSRIGFADFTTPSGAAESKT